MATETIITVPDIGGFKDVAIIEVLIQPGDVIKKEESLITLESDKAAMEIPSPQAGTVKDLKVKVGDKVGQGSAILTLIVDEAGAAPAVAPTPAPAAVEPPPPAATAAAPVAPVAEKAAPVAPPPIPEPAAGGSAHASPSVRRFARELGADVARIKGTGPKGRILKEDVQNYIKARLTAPEPSAGLSLGLLPLPEIDFAQFGPIESSPLSRIKKLTAANLHRNWVTIPHVTLQEEADITELEAFRVSLKAEADKQGVKVTLLPFLIRAVIAALKAYPQFNASLSNDGEQLILKRYYHIGIAIDTADGLVVPPLKEADGKGLFQLSKELAELGEKARAKKLRTPELMGGTFTISSLGGIGSTGFTPIINAPEVAILGVSKAQTKPVYINGEWQPRLMLPLCLSFDHRVIDGA
ncbi:MAG: branched-chain alpha-keto acid dehydrogenase subunit E2, partial [Methylococcaceae bacterium]|nr:branched-chain alpha-keto acid dehydrogenase subunit E2 [Methylococcaceae bacterium]